VTPTSTQWRELARRTGAGVEVALLWNTSVNRAKVAVSDGRLCYHVDFELDGADPLSAFHQPFADATAHLLANDLSDEVSTGASASSPAAARGEGLRS
jgi:hypothetical protein